MAEFVLQYPTEIINGPTFIVKAQHLIANFNALNSAILDRVSKTTSVHQTMQSALTINGLLTLTNGFGNNPIVPTDPILANQIATKHYVDIHTGSPIGVGHRSGIPTSLSTTTFSLAWLQESNNTGTSSVNSPITINMTTTGLNGCDSGIIGPNQYWYLYAIAKPDTTGSGMIVSQTNEILGGTIAVPTGYLGGAKIQMPFAVTTDGAATIRPFKILSGWPNMPYVSYESEYLVLVAGTSQVLSPFTVFAPTIAAQSKLQYRVSFSTPGNTGNTTVNSAPDFAHGVKILGYATTTAEYVEEDYYFHGAPLVIPYTMYYQVGGFNESLTIQYEGFQVSEVP